MLRWDLSDCATSAIDVAQGFIRLRDISCTGSYQAEQQQLQLLHRDLSYRGTSANCTGIYQAEEHQLHVLRRDYQTEGHHYRCGIGIIKLRDITTDVA
jgi:hypothetical protein